MTPAEEYWHELVLAGVGGRTIAEAKRNLSVHEFAKWIAYIRRRGSLNTGQRVEYAIGVLICQLLAITGNKVDMDRFVPHWDMRSDSGISPDDMSLEQLAAMFGVDNGDTRSR